LNRRTPRLIAVLAFGAALLVSASALATKSVQVKLDNDHRSRTMKCSVTSVHPTNGKSKTLAAYTLGAKKSQTKTLAVKYIIKRINKSVVYPHLKLTCELVGQTSRQSSPVWNHTEKSFTTYRFNSSCRDGAYCSVRVERR